jgi:AraC-like DNA-binding protein
MVERCARQIILREMNGLADAADGPAPPGTDAVVLSNIEKGAAASRGLRGLCLRFVSRGREDYRIQGRGYSLDSDRIMISAQDTGAEVEIRKRERDGTSGLCVFLAGDDDEDLPWLFGPLVASADCSAIGGLMQGFSRSARTSPRRLQLAAKLVEDLRANLPAMTGAILEQSARIDAVKPSTRHEMVRRATLAQAYLHEIAGRSVALDELGGAVGSSPFELLRAFQHCFGETPAAYHRKLRLQRALEQASRRRVSIDRVADEFGFAGGSSFSHAYRRAFGRSPKEGAGLRSPKAGHPL